MQAAPPAPSDRLHGSASRVRGPHFLHLQDRRNRSGRLDRNSASQVATTDFPTRPLPFSTRWTSTDEPFPLLELSFGIRVPLLTKEWQGWKSDSQINFFFVGSPSHMASRTLYRGLLRVSMAVASGSSLAAGTLFVGTGSVGSCLL